MNDKNIIEFYSALQKNVGDQRIITDNHARKMATMAANMAFNMYKIHFGGDLARLGLDTRFDWQIDRDAEALLAKNN